AVREVAVLGFPDDERVGLRGGVAVLETEDGFFREYRIDHLYSRLMGHHMLQGQEVAVAALIVQYRVPMEERAATAILTGDAHRKTVLDQRPVGERLRATPVQRQLACEHLLAVGDDLRHARMQGEIRRYSRQLLTERPQTPQLHSRLRARLEIRLDIRRPVDGVLVADHAQRGAGLRPSLIEPIAILLDHGRYIGFLQHTLGDQLVGVELARSRMLPDYAVHRRLRRSGLVSLVVPVAPVADEIDYDVLVEAHPILQREPR